MPGSFQICQAFLWALLQLLCIREQSPINPGMCVYLELPLVTRIGMCKVASNVWRPYIRPFHFQNFPVKILSCSLIPCLF